MQNHPKEIAFRHVHKLPVTRQELELAADYFGVERGQEEDALGSAVLEASIEQLTEQSQIIVNYEPPIDVPDGWEIWNAARPLYGHKTWQGDFVRGIFYAAIDPEHEFANGYRSENLSLDAALTIPQTNDEHRACVEAHRSSLMAVYKGKADIANAEFYKIEDSYLNRSKVRIVILRD